MKCKECGEEIISLFHRCNPFIKKEYEDSYKCLSEKKKVTI